MIKKHLGFAAGILLSSVCLGIVGVKSVQQEPVNVFLGAMGTWTGYLVAHRVSQGEFMDGPESLGQVTSRSLDYRSYAGFFSGFLVLVSALGLGVEALQQTETFLSVLAATLFFTGYIIAHYSVTGELL